MRRDLPRFYVCACVDVGVLQVFSSNMTLGRPFPKFDYWTRAPTCEMGVKLILVRWGHDIAIVTRYNNCDDGAFNPDRCVRVLVLAYFPIHSNAYMSSSAIKFVALDAFYVSKWPLSCMQAPRWMF